LEDSLTKGWERIWGYNGNHTIKSKDFVFITADTSLPAESTAYLAADLEWLKAELETHTK
jgi:hypothetical protein